jgi:hypothetical protein
MTRAGVFLTAILAAASLGLFAQDHSTSAASPSAASSSAAVAQTSSQSSTSTPAAQPGTPSTSQSTPAARDSSRDATTASPNRAIEGSASNDPVTPNGQLPQTSTILPLLGLIGLGSLVAGLFARR